MDASGFAESQTVDVGRDARFGNACGLVSKLKEEVTRKRIRPDLGADHIAALIRQAEDDVGKRTSKCAGFFFTSTEGSFYLFDGADQRVHRLHSSGHVDMRFGGLLQRRYGLKMHDNLTRLVVDALVGISMATAKRHEVRRFAYYDKPANALYLSRYSGMVYKVTARGVTQEPNGKNVFFADDDPGAGVDADVGDHGLISQLLLDDINFVEETEAGLDIGSQKLLLDVWLHSLPFVEILPTRPLLLFEGDPGAGKSAAVKRIQLLVTGKPDPWLLTKQTSLEDLAVGLTRRRIAMVDNLDSWIEWLPDVLAGQATGVGFPRRKRYTDSDAADLTNNAFITITSHDPKSLYRADVVDRTIVLRVQRRENYEGEAKVMGRIADARPKLYGEWLRGLSCVLARMEDLDSVPAQSSRMADFAQLAFVIGTALGYDEDRITKALVFAQAERESFQGESDAMMDLLEWWLNQSPNHNRAEYTATQLHSAFFGAHEHDYRFRSIGALERWLRTAERTIKRRFYFKITKKPKQKAIYVLGWKKT